MKRPFVRMAALFVIATIMIIAITIFAYGATTASADVFLDAHCGKDGSDEDSLGNIYLSIGTFSESVAIGDDISSWFENLPNGICVSVAEIDTHRQELGIIVSGVPTSEVDSGIYEECVVIPGNTIIVDGELYPLPIKARNTARFIVVESYQFIDHVTICFDYESIDFDGTFEQFCDSFRNAYYSSDANVQVYCNSYSSQEETEQVTPYISVAPKDGYKFSEKCDFSVEPEILYHSYDESSWFGANNGKTKGPFGFHITTTISRNQLETLVSNYQQKLPSSKFITFKSNGLSWKDASTLKQFVVYSEEIPEKCSSTIKLQPISDMIAADSPFRLVGWNTQADGTGIAYALDDILSYDAIEENEISLYAQYICNDEAIIAYGSCGSNVMWELDQTGKISFIGTGLIDRYEDNAYLYAPWKDYLSQITSLYVGPGVKNIPALSFMGSHLQTVELSEGVTDISLAFYGCDELQELYLPSSVTDMHFQAFEGCTSLKAINVADDNPVYSSEDGILFNKSKTKLIVYPGGKEDRKFSIPEEVYRIDDYAFVSNYYLEDLYIHERITEIGYRALPFSNMTVHFAGPEWKWNHLTKNSNLSSQPIIEFASSLDYISGTCGDTASWRLTKDGVLVISGNGAVWDYGSIDLSSNVTFMENAYEAYYQVPWGGMQDYVHTLIIEEGISRLGTCAFVKLEHRRTTIRIISLPSTLTEIAAFCFDEIDYPDDPLWFEDSAYDTVECAFYNGSKSDFSQISIGIGNNSVVQKMHYGQPVSFEPAMTYPFIEQGTEPPQLPYGKIFFADGTFETVTAGWAVTCDTSELGQKLCTIRWLDLERNFPTTIYNDATLNEMVSNGDVNGDYSVNALDLACLYTYLAEENNCGQINNQKIFQKKADVNGDGYIDVYDLQLLYENLCGLGSLKAGDE